MDLIRHKILFICNFGVVFPCRMTHDADAHTQNMSNLTMLLFFISTLMFWHLFVVVGTK